MSELSSSELNRVTASISDYMRDNIGANRIYGPADRHGVIEWQYLLRTSRGIQQFATFAAWTESDDRFLEGWASVTTDEGARSLPVRRTRFEPFLPGVVDSPEFNQLLGDTLARAEFMLGDLLRSSSASDFMDRPFLVDRRRPPSTWFLP